MTDRGADIRKGREGSRWFNERPDAEAVAEWFKGVPLHEELEANRDRYLGGIVLIEGTLKAKEIRGFNQETGAPIITDSKVEHLTYTPYPKVETRVQYFHDLMAEHADEWLGVIEPVAGGQDGLPPGFFARTVNHHNRQGQPAITRYICCTMRCVVYDRASYEEKWYHPQTRPGDRNPQEPRLLRSGKTVIAGAPATKMVPLLQYPDKPDPFSMMKAETGATGRALGMAGMLVVPGAGVATAEDMNEAGHLDETGTATESPQASQAPPPEAAAKPPASAEEAQDEEAALRTRAGECIRKLRADYPDAYERFKEWASERGVENLSDQTGPTLKGLVRKAEKTLDEAEHAPEPEPEAPPAEPAAEPEATGASEPEEPAPGGD